MSIQTCKEILLHIKKLYQEARSSKNKVFRYSFEPALTNIQNYVGSLMKRYIST